MWNKVSENGACLCGRAEGKALLADFFGDPDGVLRTVWKLAASSLAP
jgi:hypothetical protein